MSKKNGRKNPKRRREGPPRPEASERPYLLFPKPGHYNPSWVFLPASGEDVDTMAPPLRQVAAGDFDPVQGGDLKTHSLIRRGQHHHSRPWILLLSMVLIDGLLSPLGFTPADGRPPPVTTQTRWTASLMLFEKWNVLEKSTLTSPLAFSKFFPVPKKNGKARIIIDSREAGRLCDRPPPVNLPAISEVINQLSKCRYFWTGDLKHWFYQIPLPKELRDLFTLQTEGRRGCHHRRRMKVLPMGWSWSPYFAQALAWLLVLHVAGRCPKHVASTCGALPPQDLPQWLPLLCEKTNRQTGVILIWYDNIMIASEHANQVERWKQHIADNAKAVDCRWSDFPEKVAQEVEFLGIIFKYDGASSHFSWRHAPKKAEKIIALRNRIAYRSRDDPAPTPDTVRITPREVASATGLLVWHQMVSLQPLFHLSEAIDLLREARDQPNFTASTWDVPILLPRSAVDHVNEQLEVFLLKPNFSFNNVKPGSHEAIRIAVDAAGEETHSYAGLVLMDPCMEKCEVRSVFFPPEILAADIAVRELWAIAEALKLWGHGKDVILGSDSAVARSQVRRTIAHNALTNRILEEIFAVRWHNLRSIFIYSEDNVADCPSRGIMSSGHELEAARFTATSDLLYGRTYYLNVEKKLAPGMDRNTKANTEGLSELTLECVEKGLADWSLHNNEWLVDLDFFD